MPRHHTILARAREARDARVDQTRVEREACLRAEVEFLEDPGAEGVDEDVDLCGAEEGVEEGDGERGFQVEGERGFVAGEEVVCMEGVCGGGGGAVDSEDGGAVVGEEEAGEGAVSGSEIER